MTGLMSDKLSKHELFLIFSLNMTQHKLSIDNCGCDCVAVVCKIFYICESDITKYVSSHMDQELVPIMGHVPGLFIGVKGHFDYWQLFT